MKHCGLGTPATRAQILEKLIHVNYIIRDKNKLIPTEKGIYIIDSVKDSVLGSAELTGEWEKQLNEMAEGKKPREEFMTDIKEFTKEIVQNISQSTAYAVRADQTVYADCPACKLGKIVEMKSSYSCTRWKEAECKFAIWKVIAGKAITETMVKKLMKDGKTSVIKGFKNKAGNAFNASLEINNNEVKMSFEQDSIANCPCCEDGEIIETPKAYSCNKWRDNGCKAVIWKEIAQRKISQKEVQDLLKNGQTELLTGFKSKQGKEFSAALQFKDNKVEFIFNN
jgi:DNA topoisomerase-3